MLRCVYYADEPYAPSNDAWHFSPLTGGGSRVKCDILKIV